MKGKIAEIFQSIQGEGIYTGQKQVFVRFYGCNLTCRFCDTKLKTFNEYTAAELMEEIAKIATEAKVISFTGGEPLLQKEFLKEILALTRAAGYTNYLETNGTLPDELSDVIEGVDIVAMDFKLPSATGMEDFWGQHKRFLEIARNRKCFVKAVVGKDTASADIWKTIEVIKEVDDTTLVVLQPENNARDRKMKVKLNRLEEIFSENNIGAFIGSQMHKQLGIK